MNEPYRPAPTPEQQAIIDQMNQGLQGDPHQPVTLCQGAGEPNPDARGTLPCAALVKDAYPSGAYVPEAYMAKSAPPEPFSPATLKLTREANWKILKSSLRTAWKSLVNIITSTWRLWRKK